MCTKYIPILKNKIINVNNKLVFTADFETLLIQNEHFVFAIGSYRNGAFKNYYIEKGLINEEEIKIASQNLIVGFINDLLQKKNQKIYVYMHNLGSFDGIFILKYLKYYNINKKDFSSVIRNNRIYRIKIKNVVFLDSILILNDSLDNLAKFLLNDRKIIVDYNIMSNYSSCISNYSEIIKYLYKDVKLLYNIITNFRQTFIDFFNIDITINFTIPSIAMSIYRTHYMKEEIFIPRNEVYKFINKSYKGGLNNIIIPKMENGYIYDINSLYPFIMQTSELPIGEPNWIHKNFEDITNYHGFIDCTIDIPLDCLFPPLCIKMNGSLIQPVGIIRDVFYSEEIKNSLQYNCKIIEIHKVCNFKRKGILFKEYVEDMYNKRIKIDNNIENMMYKLLMNSLYGRFGIKNEFSKTKILDDEEKWLYNLVYNIDNIYNDSNIVNYSANLDYIRDLKRDLNCLDYTENNKKIILNEIYKTEIEISQFYGSVQIASAIASYARIYLTNIIYDHIRKNKANIYYYDTDSIHTDKELDCNICSETKLGCFKLETKVKESYYLSPKVYGILDVDDNEIIKFKGISKDISKILNIDWFKKTYYNAQKIEFSYIKPIRKNLTNLRILRSEAKFQSDFQSQKYKKVFENNIWIRNNWIIVHGIIEK